MSDNKPAFSAEEWAEVRGDGLDMYHEFVTYTPESIPRLIAALNYDLPDSDPRKITRETCSAIRHGRIAYPEGSASWRELTQIADALESYLPPDTK